MVTITELTGIRASSMLVGDHLLTITTITIIINGIGAVTNRAQQFHAVCAGHSRL